MAVFAGLRQRRSGRAHRGGRGDRRRAKPVDRIRGAGPRSRGNAGGAAGHTRPGATGDLVVTGPTGTNVADIWMSWRQVRVSTLSLHVDFDVASFLDSGHLAEFGHLIVAQWLVEVETHHGGVVA